MLTPFDRRLAQRGEVRSPKRIEKCVRSCTQHKLEVRCPVASKKADAAFEIAPPLEPRAEALARVCVWERLHVPAAPDAGAEVEGIDDHHDNFEMAERAFDLFQPRLQTFSLECPDKCNQPLSPFKSDQTTDIT